MWGVGVWGSVMYMRTKRRVRQHATRQREPAAARLPCCAAPALPRCRAPPPPRRRPAADKRYQRHDKRDKLPAWITQHLKDSHLNLSTDMLLCIARDFMRAMAQPYDRAALGRSLLSEAAVNALDTAAAAAPQAQAGPAPMQTD